ncbi:tRNA (guanosine(46)-N7)-methyltransferase TrmB [Bauldia sp.]|uniref:tRNA (guanosine(46)-N7)-methyltransferase TrmB n=1 Tax=Bauldia sp. TaxID=2575872 RepID=UPI003BACD44D
MQRRSSLFGRRKGKPLSPLRAGLMEAVYPGLAVDLDVPPPEPLTDLFSVPVDTVRVEIGFGGGEHLVGAATREPGTGFIGVEPFVAGLANAVTAIDDAGLRNVRLFDDDAADLLDWLPPDSIAGVDLFYPDPWPKRRHWKRRFVKPENLDRVARVLIHGGRFRFASDSSAYVTWTLRHLRARSDFVWLAETADDWRLPYADWPGTRYEAKAIAAGRVPTYLTFERR